MVAFSTLALSALCASFVYALPTPVAPLAGAPPAQPIICNKPLIAEFPGSDLAVTQHHLSVTLPFRADVTFYLFSKTSPTFNSIRALSGEGAVLTESLFATGANQGWLQLPASASGATLRFDFEGTGAGLFWALCECKELAPLPVIDPIPPPPVTPVAPVEPVMPPPPPVAPVAPVDPVAPVGPILPPPPPVTPVAPVTPTTPLPPAPLALGPMECGMGFQRSYGLTPAETGLVSLETTMTVVGSMAIYVNGLIPKKISAFLKQPTGVVPLASTQRPGMQYLYMSNVAMGQTVVFQFELEGQGDFYCVTNCLAPPPTPAPTTAMPTTASPTAEIVPPPGGAAGPGAATNPYYYYV